MWDTVVFILQQTVNVALNVLMFAFMARMIVSLFDMEGDSRIGQFLFVITEPFVIPMRMLFAKMHWFEGTPMDFAYLFTSLALIILRTLLIAFWG